MWRAKGGDKVYLRHSGTSPVQVVPNGREQSSPDSSSQQARYQMPVDAHAYPMQKTYMFKQRDPVPWRSPPTATDAVPTLLAPHASQCVGKGCYGSTHVISGDRAFAWASRNALAYRVVSDALMPTISSMRGKEIVIKLQLPETPTIFSAKRESESSFIARALEESKIHAYLTTAKRTISEKEYVAAEVVPRFFLSGFFRDANTGLLTHIQMMEKVDGVPLSDVLTRDNIEKLFPFLEEALATLWACGVAHADVHSKNVMVGDGRLVLVDFGRSFRIPGDVQRIVDEKIARGDLDGAWFGSGLQEVAMATMRSADIGFFNPNGHYLRMLYHGF
jgi:hypothetical protein